MDTKQIKQKILDLAIRGKLVPQNPADEPASVLLERIKAEKAQLIKEGKIKKEKPLAPIEEVPFEIPESWEWTTIGEFTGDLKYGTAEKSLLEGRVAVLRMGNITRDGSIDYSDLVYTNNESDIEKYLLKEGDILFNRTNSREWVGKCAIYHEGVPAIYAGYIIRFTPIELNPEYINYVMISSYERDYCAKVKTDGINQSNINSVKLSKFQVPIPPLEEQKRIVAEIDRWFKFIDELEQNQQDLHTAIKQAKSKILDLAIHGKLVPQDPNDGPVSPYLDEVKSSIVREKKKKSAGTTDVEPFFEVPDTWEWCKLYDICPFLTRGKSPKYSETDNKYPVFAQKCNLKEGGISLDKALFLDPSTLSKWTEEYHLQTGDILINSTGTGTVGRTRLFNESCLGKYPFVVPDSHVSVVRTSNKICSEFIFAYISSTIGQEYIESNLAGSTNQKELYIGVLENMVVPIPPFKEQKRITKKIEKIFAQIDQITKLLL